MTPQKEDRGLGRGQHAGFLFAEAATAADFGQRGQHHRQRLLVPPLTLPQRVHGLWVGGVDDQLEPAQPLHRQHAALDDRLGRPPQGLGPVGQLPSLKVQQLQLRAAVGAGDRLGVEPPVGRIGVLGRTGRAHVEAGHAGPRAVVGQVLDDRPARPAVGAIGEGIAEPPLARRVNLLAALGAGRQVGGNRRPGRSLVRAAANLERRRAVRLPGLRTDVQGVDLRLGRRRAAQQVQELIQCGGLPLDLDPHRAGLVLYPAGQSAGGSGVVDEGPEADPLDDPPHGDRQPLRRRR